MSMPRATLLRRLAHPGAAGRVARSQFRNTRWQRRGYASGGPGSGGQQKVSSDLPWLFGAVAVSVPGTYLVLKTDQLGNPLSHPYPGDHYHGKHDDEEHGDDEHEESDDAESKDEPAEEESKDEPAEKESKDDAGDESAASDASKDEAPEGGEKQSAPDDDANASRGSKATGKNVSERPSSGTLSGKRQVKGAADGDTHNWDEEHEYEHDRSRVIHKPDAKGGAKRRIESPYGLKQGLGENNDDNLNKSTPVAGNTSKLQYGISNTDTKHSYDLMADPEKSKKPEGVPETAKLQTTVDPRR